MFHYAIRASAPLYVVESLLDSGLDPNLADHDGWTPLHLFVRLNKTVEEAILSLLLDHGADPNKITVSVDDDKYMMKILHTRKIYIYITERR